MARPVDGKEVFTSLLFAIPEVVQACTHNGMIHISGPNGILPEKGSHHALFFRSVNIEADSSFTIRKETFRVRCYGESAWHANQMLGLLHEVLHWKRFTVYLDDTTPVSIFLVRENPQSDDMIDPLSEWNFVETSYIVDMQYYHS